MQPKDAILRGAKQQLPNEIKEKEHLDELLRSLDNQISLETEIGFVREEVKERNNVIRTLLRQNFCECNSSSPFESPKLDNISEINEERRETYISTTSNPIQSDNNRRFTKYAKQKSRMNDVQVDSVIRSHPDETTHSTNTGVMSSNINEMCHTMNKENRPPDKEKDKPPPPSQNPINFQKSKTSVFIDEDSIIKKVNGYLLTSTLKY